MQQLTVSLNFWNEDLKTENLELKAEKAKFESTLREKDNEIAKLMEKIKSLESI